MAIGATDMGTGCDTILAQMAAESLDCPIENIAVHGVDTDHSPYDCGSYASSTTYVTGMAVVKTCEKLIRQLEAAGAKLLACDAEKVVFEGDGVRSTKDELQGDVGLDCRGADDGVGGYHRRLCVQRFADLAAAVYGRLCGNRP